MVERIKANPNRCEMLVISEEGAKWYNENNVQITLDLPNIERVSPMVSQNVDFIFTKLKKTILCDFSHSPNFILNSKIFNM